MIHPATIGVAAVQGKIVSEFDIAYRNKGQFNQAIVNFLKSQHLRVYGTKNGFNDNRMGHLVSKDPYWQSLYKKNENRGKTSLSIPMITENKAIPASMSLDEFFELVTKQTKQASILPQTTDVQQRANVHVNPAHETKLFTDPKVALNKMALTGNFLLQSWALMTMWNDPMLKSTRDNFYEKHGKLVAGFIGVAMASLEGISYLLNVYVNSGAKINSKIININRYLSGLTNIETKLWRGLGSAVGFIFGAYDFYNGWKAFNEKDEVLYGGGMMMSGATVSISALAFYLFGASNPGGWILLLVGIGIGVIANLARDNDLQKWLYKSLLGTGKSYKRFENYNDQTLEFSEKFVALGMSA